MLNKDIYQDEIAVGEIINLAKRAATAPNQATPGNAASVTGRVNDFIVAPPEPTGEMLPPGIYPDEIGINAQGEYWHPFYLGVDTPDDPFAYVPTGYPIYDYGS